MNGWMVAGLCLGCLMVGSVFGLFLMSWFVAGSDAVRLFPG